MAPASLVALGNQRTLVCQAACLRTLRPVNPTVLPSPLSGRRHQTRQCCLSLPSRVTRRHSATRDTQAHLSDQLSSCQKDAEANDVEGLKRQTTGAIQLVDREGIEPVEVERALPCNLQPAASSVVRMPSVGNGGHPSDGHTDGPIRSFFRWAQRTASGGSDSVLRLQSPPVATLAAAGTLAGLSGTGFDGSGVQGVAAAVAVLTTIVAVHELGHFTAARSQGIHVSKFAIGFGPVIWSYKRNDVEYSLRAIPMGGFVAFPEDVPDGGDSKYPKDDPDLLQNRPILDRALVISGGVVFNLIFAYSILLTQVATVGVPLLKWQPGVQVPEVLHRSAAERAGLQNGDIILGLNGQPLLPSPTSVARTVEYIKDNPGRECQLTIQRGDAKPFPLTITPDLAPNSNEGIIGVKLHENAKVLRRYAKGPLDACREAGLEFLRLGSQITGGLAQMVSRFGEVQDKIQGPVAIINVGADVARTDRSGLFQFAAAINLNLAVVNALPLPALDGGYLALLLLEAVRGKKLGEITEKSLVVFGVLLLTSSGLFLILRDLSKLGG